MVKVAALALAFLMSCSLVTKKPKTLEPSLDIRVLYQYTIDRLPRFLDGGVWVVSRGRGGVSEDTGDSLISTGIALAGLPCEGLGHEISVGMAEAIIAADGQLYRHPKWKTEISLDGALGLYRGVARRITDCGEADLWRPAFLLHYDYVKFSGGKLNSGDSAKLEKEFNYILDLLAFKLALREAPSKERQALLMAQVTEWTRMVMAAKAACFRVHLAYLVVKTMEILGQPPNVLQRSGFCGAVENGGTLLADHYCGTGNLIEYLESYKFDMWNYRFSKCPAWQEPDGNGEIEFPAIDLILGVREAFHI